MTGPAFGGTGRGTGAPSRATGTRETVGAVLLVLAAGLALRLIIAQLIPGSGFDVDITAFRAWMSDLAAHGPYGFYDRPFFHDYTPGYLLGLWFMGTLGNILHWSTWIDAVPWARFLTDLDLKALPILADLVIGWLVHSMVLELGGRRRACPGGRRDRRPQSDLLVRQRRLGPGRLGRRGLPPPRPSRDLARPARAGGDLCGHRRDHQAAAGDPPPDRGHRHDQARALARRRDGRAGHDRSPDPDPDHGVGRVPHGRGAVSAVRPVGRVVQRSGAVHQLGPARADRQGGRRVSVPDRQCLQPLGDRAGRRGEQPRHVERLDLRLRRQRAAVRRRQRNHRGASRPS